MQENKPGEVIVPHQQEPESSSGHAQAEAPVSAVTTNPSNDTLPPAQPPTPPTVPTPNEPVQPVSNFYRPSQSPPDSSAGTADDEVISWEADEFIAQEKERSWYGIVMLVAVVITLLVYLLNRDIITSALVLVALGGLAAFSGRRPRRQQFAVAPEGIQVGRMFYAFADFRSFAVAEEKIGHSLVLVSLKRFVPAINIYIPPEYEEAVVELVASILPMEAHKPDFVERFMNRIRF